MSLSAEQVVLLRQAVRLELSYLEGEPESIKQVLLIYACSTGQTSYCVNKQTLDQVKPIKKLLQKPYTVIGNAVLSLEGEFEGRRRLVLEDHEEAVRIVQEEIQTFVDSDPLIPVLQQKEKKDYQPYPLPSPPSEIFNEHVPIVRLFIQVNIRALILLE